MGSDVSRRDSPGGDVPAVEAVGLTRAYRDAHGWRTVVRDVSLSIHVGETLALVGESGAGKSTVGRMLVRLEEPDHGEVRWAGRAAGRVRGRALRRARRRCQMVFQNPTGSLNPRMTVGAALLEAVRLDGEISVADARRRVHDLLDAVGLSTVFHDRFPAELSGGQAQRVALARALAADPVLLVLDEPFSALDPVAAAELIDLLLRVQATSGLACLLITHDLGIVGHLADRVAVMRDGEVVESAEAAALFASPAHAYTRELLAAVPGRTLMSMPDGAHSQIGTLS